MYILYGMVWKEGPIVSLIAKKNMYPLVAAKVCNESKQDILHMEVKYVFIHTPPKLKRSMGLRATP